MYECKKRYCINVAQHHKKFTNDQVIIHRVLEYSMYKTQVLHDADIFNARIS